MPTDPPQAPTLTMKQHTVLKLWAAEYHKLGSDPNAAPNLSAESRQYKILLADALTAALDELDAQRREVSTLREALADRDEVIEDKRRLTKEIGDILDGPNAARQPSLCDLVAPIRALEQRALQAEGTVRTLRRDVLTEVIAKLAEMRQIERDTVLATGCKGNTLTGIRESMQMVEDLLRDPPPAPTTREET